MLDLTSLPERIPLQENETPTRFNQFEFSQQKWWSKEFPSSTKNYRYFPKSATVYYKFSLLTVRSFGEINENRNIKRLRSVKIINLSLSEDYCPLKMNNQNKSCAVTLYLPNWCPVVPASSSVSWATSHVHWTKVVKYFQYGFFSKVKKNSSRVILILKWHRDPVIKLQRKLACEYMEFLCKPLSKFITI